MDGITAVTAVTAASASPEHSSAMADGWTPLYLSTLAGMSTCLGAAIVFCHPREKNSVTGQYTSDRRIVSPNMMAFSLALAGSVMLTVSVISIGPECLLDPRYEDGGAADGRDGDEGGGDGGGGGGATTGIGRMMPIFSYLFLQRLISFGLGCLLYGLLRLAFPEVEDLETELLTTTDFGKRRNDWEHRTTVTAKAEEIDIGGSDNMSGDVEMASNGDNDMSIDKNSNARDRSSSPNRGNLRKRSDSADPPTNAEMQSLLRQDGDDGYDAKSKGGTTSSSLHNLKTSGNGGGGGGSDGGNYATSMSLSSSSGVVPGGAAAAIAGGLRSKPSFRSWASGEDLGTKDQRRAWRVAMLLFVSLLCHNFPEGLAVAASALESDKLGITVTVGIMIHNIPEGIAIAVPCLAARPESPWLSFLLASFSGLAEPFGAFVALGFLRGYNVESTLGGTTTGDAAAAAAAAAVMDRGFLSLENVLAFVAGIMITVALVELFPEARRHVSVTKAYFYGGTISGIVVMVLTELVT